MQPSPCKELKEVFVCILSLLRKMEVGSAVFQFALLKVTGIWLTSATLGFIFWELWLHWDHSIQMLTHYRLLLTVKWSQSQDLTWICIYKTDYDPNKVSQNNWNPISGWKNNLASDWCCLFLLFKKKKRKKKEKNLGIAIRNLASTFTLCTLVVLQLNTPTKPTVQFYHQASALVWRHFSNCKQCQHLKDLTNKKLTGWAILVRTRTVCRDGALQHRSICVIFPQ